MYIAGHGVWVDPQDSLAGNRSTEQCRRIGSTPQVFEELVKSAMCFVELIPEHGNALVVAHELRLMLADVRC